MTSTTIPAYRRVVALGSAFALTALLASCASADTADEEGADAAVDSAASDAESLSVTDPWAKATDTEMTAAFGEIENNGEADIRIVSAETDVSPMAELHTMAAGDSGEMVMSEIEDGFLIPAGGSLILEPGGDHVMIMGVTDPIEPGADVAVTLTLDDGSTLDVVAPARSFSGANESYDGGSEDMDHGDMDHGDMDHGDMDHGDMDHGDMDHEDTDHS